MVVADLADAAEIARRRGTAPSDAPTTVSAKKAVTLPAPISIEVLFELLREAYPYCFGRSSSYFSDTGRRARRAWRRQQRRICEAAPAVAAHRKRAERVAVIALAPGDEFLRCGWPISTKYWRAILSAASIASDPPETRYTCPIPGGASATRTFRPSTSATSVVKKLVWA